MTLTVRSRQQKLWKWQRANNIQIYTDSEPVRAHVQHLLDMDMTAPMIAQAAGCSDQTIYFLANGMFPRTKLGIAIPVRGVTHHPHPNATHALAIGARRRVEALIAIGWQSQYIAERLGISHRTRLMTMLKQPRIAYGTWLAIEVLYDELSGTPGPSSYSMNRAKKYGFMPPLAWEDLDIDHPEHQAVTENDSSESDDAIDEVLFQRILNGRHSGETPKAERKAVLDYAVKHGWGGTKVAEVLNLSKDAGDVSIRRHRRKLRQRATDAA